MSTLPAIKPCPFCGAPASVEVITYADRRSRYSVGCDSETEVDCYGYQSLTEFDTPAAAVTAWNRRKS